uniref:Uncharacterized protein n=1 Tax=Panagrolaimus sp. JU765 TaxID=591449 RepID=A0AC34R2X0_9BILA
MSQNALNKKDFLFLNTEGGSGGSITDKIKNFLPKIAKANEELESADEATRKNLIMEQDLKELTDDDEGEEANYEDEEEGSGDEDEGDLEEEVEEDHVAVTFTTFKEDGEKNAEDSGDFVVRKSEDEPASKKPKVDE